MKKEQLSLKWRHAPAFRWRRAGEPGRASTYGVGGLIADALEQGCREFVLIGLGGSATNDGGCGMAAALGVRFLNKEGKPFSACGREPLELCSIDMSGLHPA